MIAAENEIAIPARPEAVWEVLLDFERYPSWHPSIELVGDPSLGAKIEYRYTGKMLGMGRLRKMHSFARITALAAPIEFAWRMSMGSFLFRIDESYRLERHPTGTRLAHRVEYRGVVARLWRAGITSRAHVMICETDTALRARFVKRPPPRKRGRR